MALTIELSPETRERLFEEARLRRQTPEELVRQAVEERYSRAAQIEKNQAAIRLLEQWSREDAEDPDPDPVPEIPRLSLREVRID
jgi:predicted transcriptional regulator